MNKLMIITAAATWMIGGMVAEAGCGGCAPAAEHQHDIVDTAVEAGSFNTLVAAVKAAGDDYCLPIQRQILKSWAPQPSPMAEVWSRQL